MEVGYTCKCINFFILRAVLNVCFAYTARDDMCNAMRELSSGVKDGFIRERLESKASYYFHTHSLFQSFPFEI